MILAEIYILEYICHAKGFGAIIKKNQLYKNDLFNGAGGYVNLSDSEFEVENTITLLKGKYVCMYKYGMPYDIEFLYKLIK